MNKWYSQGGVNSDVAISSKISLSRNLKDVPFPCRMTDEQRKAVCKRIYAVIQNSKLAGEFDLIELDSIPTIEKVSLAEKGIISKSLAKQEQYGAVLVSKDESVSIMLCEEEHIIINTFASGQELQKAYDLANEIDNELISGLKIAFSEKLGFLTSNPMKLGTGMKASIRLHLPAITDNSMLSALKNMLSKLGFELKRLYQEGAFYEFSNNVTLGITESSAIENLNGICDQIINQERAIRTGLTDYENYMDKIYRAMGTLKMARQLSAAEFYHLISLVRLGVAINAFDEVGGNEFEAISELIHTLGPATIISDSKSEITIEEANRLRAKLVRERLG